MAILTHYTVKGQAPKYLGRTLHSVHDHNGAVHTFYTAFLKNKQTTRTEKGGSDNTLASDFLGLKMLESLIVLFGYEEFHQHCAYGEGITDEQVNYLNQHLDLEPKALIALAEKKLGLIEAPTSIASATIGDPEAVIRAELQSIPEATVMTRRVRKKTVREYLTWLHTHGNHVLANHFKVPMDLRTKRNERTEQYKKIVVPKILSNQTTTATVDPQALDEIRAFLKEDMSKKVAQEIWRGEGAALRNRCMIYTQYYAGVRMGELLAMKWDPKYKREHQAAMNCDFNRPGEVAKDVGAAAHTKTGRLRTTKGIVHVRQRLTSSRADDPRPTKHTPMPKTRERQISVREDFYWQTFSDYLNIYNSARRELHDYDASLNHPYFFISLLAGQSFGNALSMTSYRNVFSKLCRYLGINRKHLGSHSLRVMACLNFVEQARAAGQTNEAIQTGMLTRFGWSPYSKMPTHYTEHDTKEFIASTYMELIDDDDT